MASRLPVCQQAGVTPFSFSKYPGINAAGTACYFRQHILHQINSFVHCSNKWAFYLLY